MANTKKTTPSPPAKQQAPSQTDEQKAIVTQSLTQSWSGPLPPPRDLESFNDVVPGSAKTIIEMAQNQQEHRIRMESMGAHDSRFALRFGAVILVIAILSAVYLADKAPTIAAGLISLPVLSVVGLLITQSKKHNRSEKSNTQRKK